MGKTPRVCGYLPAGGSLEIVHIDHVTYPLCRTHNRGRYIRDTKSQQDPWFQSCEYNPKVI